MQHLITIVGIICLLSAGAFAQKDFYGDWKLDQEASTRVSRRPDSVTMTVAKTGKEMPVTTHVVMSDEKDGSSPTDRIGSIYIYRLDGKDRTGELRTPTRVVPATTRLVKEGKKLVLIRELGEGAAKSTIKQTWELSADGKTLTTFHESTPRDRTSGSKRIFIRK